MSETLERSTNWLAVVGVVGSGIVAAAQIGKLPAALPLLRTEIGLTLVEAGWVVSAITTVGVVTGIVTGRVIDHIGALRIQLAALILLAGGGVWGSFATNMSALLAARVLEGFGYIAVITSGPSLILAVTAPRDRSFAMGLWTVYFPSGISMMIVLSPWLLERISWRGLWLVNAGFALAVALTVLLLFRGISIPKTVQDTRTLVSGIVRTVIRPGPITLAVAFGTYGLTYLAVVAFLPSFLIEHVRDDPRTAAVMVGAAVFMNAPGCVLAGALLRRGVAPWMMIGLGNIFILITALGIYSEMVPDGVRYLLAFLFFFGGGLVPPTILSRVSFHAVSPVLIATTVGLIVQMTSLGQLIGPPLLAEIVTGTGDWPAAAWVTTVFAGVGMVAALSLRRLETG